MNSCFTKFIIFFTAVFMFPLAVFGQATFSSNMSKVEGASDETKERLIKNCDENTDCVGVINQNIFAITNQQIMFTAFPEITELPADAVSKGRKSFSSEKSRILRLRPPMCFPSDVDIFI